MMYKVLLVFSIDTLPKSMAYYFSLAVSRQYSSNSLSFLSRRRGRSIHPLGKPAVFGNESLNCRGGRLGYADDAT